MGCVSPSLAALLVLGFCIGCNSTSLSSTPFSSQPTTNQPSSVAHVEKASHTPEYSEVDEFMNDGHSVNGELSADLGHDGPVSGRPMSKTHSRKDAKLERTHLEEKKKRKRKKFAPRGVGECSQSESKFIRVLAATDSSMQLQFGDQTGAYVSQAFQNHRDFYWNGDFACKIVPSYGGWVSYQQTNPQNWNYRSCDTVDSTLSTALAPSDSCCQSEDLEACGVGTSVCVQENSSGFAVSQPGCWQTLSVTRQRNNRTRVDLIVQQLLSTNPVEIDAFALVSSLSSWAFESYANLSSPARFGAFSAVQFFTVAAFAGGARGVALGGVCQTGAPFVGAISITETTLNPYFVGSLWARVTALGFNATYDSASGFIMDSGMPTASRVYTTFSNQTVAQLNDYFEYSYGVSVPSCLIAPTSADQPDASICGDGNLDPGEDCDPGFGVHDPCCHGCLYARGCVCVSSQANQCCIGGKIAPPWQLCRPAAGQCDKPEYCDGLSGVCPIDLSYPNGMLCGPDGNCFQGKCVSLTQQCTYAFGASTDPCPGASTCDRLSCSVSTQFCPLKSVAVVDGTPCGSNRQCLGQTCVDSTEAVVPQWQTGPWMECDHGRQQRSLFCVDERGLDSSGCNPTVPDSIPDRACTCSGLPKEVGLVAFVVPSVETDGCIGLLATNSNCTLACDSGYEPSGDMSVSCVNGQYGDLQSACSVPGPSIVEAHIILTLWLNYTDFELAVIDSRSGFIANLSVEIFFQLGFDLTMFFVTRITPSPQGRDGRNLAAIAFRSPGSVDTGEDSVQLRNAILFTQEIDAFCTNPNHAWHSTQILKTIDCTQMYLTTLTSVTTAISSTLCSCEVARQSVNPQPCPDFHPDCPTRPEADSWRAPLAVALVCFCVVLCSVFICWFKKSCVVIRAATSAPPLAGKEQTSSVEGEWQQPQYDYEPPPIPDCTSSIVSIPSASLSSYRLPVASAAPSASVSASFPSSPLLSQHDTTLKQNVRAGTAPSQSSAIAVADDTPGPGRQTPTLQIQISSPDIAKRGLRSEVQLAPDARGLSQSSSLTPFSHPSASRSRSPRFYQDAVPVNSANFLRRPPTDKLTSTHPHASTDFESMVLSTPTKLAADSRMFSTPDGSPSSTAQPRGSEPMMSSGGGAEGCLRTLQGNVDAHESDLGLLTSYACFQEIDGESEELLVASDGCVEVYLDSSYGPDNMLAVDELVGKFQAKRESKGEPNFTVRFFKDKKGSAFEAGTAVRVEHDGNRFTASSKFHYVEGSTEESGILTALHQPVPKDKYMSGVTVVEKPSRHFSSTDEDVIPVTVIKSGTSESKDNVIQCQAYAKYNQLTDAALCFDKGAKWTKVDVPQANQALGRSGLRDYLLDSGVGVAVTLEKKRVLKYEPADSTGSVWASMKKIYSQKGVPAKIPCEGGGTSNKAHVVTMKRESTSSMAGSSGASVFVGLSNGDIDEHNALVGSIRAANQSHVFMTPSCNLFSDGDPKDRLAKVVD